jgi:DNA-binding transcriptional ArsR family regulator
MSWAMKIRKADLSDSSARHVLLCLANYAGVDGRGCFPAAATLSEDTGLSERTVRYKLELLREAGWIIRGNQALAAVYIDERDRRPVVYDLNLLRGANSAPRSKRGADDDTGCNLQQDGVQISTERGAESAPNTPINHQLTEEQQQRAILELVAEQDRKALEPVDDRQRYSMFADWAPDDETVAAQLTIAALPADALTDELLRGFKGFFAAKSSTVDSSGGWCFRLVTWIKRDRVKSAGTLVEPEPSATDDWASKGVVL